MAGLFLAWVRPDQGIEAPAGDEGLGGIGRHQIGPVVLGQGRYSQGTAVPGRDHHVHREGDPDEL